MGKVVDKRKMYNYKWTSLICLLFVLLPVNIQSNLVLIPFSGVSNTVNINIFRIYSDLNLQDLSFEAFYNGYKGMGALNEADALNNDSIITIIDFSKPSTCERLFIIDLKNRIVLFHSLVAHGQNSGDLFANSFSNVVNSHQSSLGLYVTGSVYYGKHGYSLQLDGVEKGINDKAKERAIVMHGADYVCQDYIDKYGRLGRSFGCPAIPKVSSKKIINVIKGGSCMYLYHPSSPTELNLALN